MKKSPEKASPKKARPAPRKKIAAVGPERLSGILERLDRIFPDPKCELDHASPFQLIIAVILSAQCTDKRVNMVTPILFAKWPNARALAGARQIDVEDVVKSTGFFRNKAKNIIACAQRIVDAFGGEVPGRMDDLLTLAGVARKTANVVLGECFGIAEGVVVDTHVTRLSGLLGLTKATDPKKIEDDLMRILPHDRRIRFSHQLILHGRRTCIANRPQCGDCGLVDLCPSARP